MDRTRRKCPRCEIDIPNLVTVIRKGKYWRKSDSKWVQKYYCKQCGYYFCPRTKEDTWRLQHPGAMEDVKRFLCSGVSRRQTARALRLSRKTVEKRFEILAARAAQEMEDFVGKLEKQDRLFFDEMESYEHTKLKPLTIPLVVTAERFIVSIDVGSMAAKGHLAEKSRKKYPHWKSEREEVTHRALKAIETLVKDGCRITTDEFPTYPNLCNFHFPKAHHYAVPGGRGCIAGYEELKRKHFDPMFALNHTAAMLRDHLATLKRKTWTTTKNRKNLKKLVLLYSSYHNEHLARQQRARH